MNDAKIAVIDYGAGNLRSVAKAIEWAGALAVITRKPEEISKADAVVLPGQGACDMAMQSLNDLKLIEVINDVVHRNIPFLGVCLGLQLLFDWTEEGNTNCLGLFPGKVKKFPPVGKIPHMGWTTIYKQGSHSFLNNVLDESYFYFVHSYYVDLGDQPDAACYTNYGIEFCSAFASGNIMGTQFHPEKSGILGLQLYKNFVNFLK